MEKITKSQKYIKLSQASTVYGISVDTLRKAIYNKTLPAWQFGLKPKGKDTRPYLLRPTDIEALMTIA